MYLSHGTLVAFLVSDLSLQSIEFIHSYVTTLLIMLVRTTVCRVSADFFWGIRLHIYYNAVHCFNRSTPADACFKRPSVQESPYHAPAFTMKNLVGTCIIVANCTL